MNILAVDPGLDATGVAVLDYAMFVRLGATPQAGIRALMHSDTITTSPDRPYPERIFTLCQELHRKALVFDCQWGVMEWPAYHGTYGRGTASRPSLNALYLAMGAVLATMTSTMGADVAVHQVGQTSKAERHGMLEQAHSDVPGLKPLPTGPRGGRREDELDAIYLGWWAMLGGDPQPVYREWKRKHGQDAQKGA